MIDVIGREDVQALKALVYIFDRFRIDAGFDLPGISSDEILPSVAEEFEAGDITAERLADLARAGLLIPNQLAGGRVMYTVSDHGVRLARAS